MIVHGEDVPHPGCLTVRTFREPDVVRFVGRRRSVVNEIVLHETVTRSWKATVEVLRQRKLSVHLIVDADGAVYQHGDLRDDLLWHASEHNPTSVGIEVVAPYDPRLLKPGDPWTTVIDAPWAHRGKYVVPTPEQAEATVHLVRWLTSDRGLSIPRTWQGLRGACMAMGRVAATGPGIYAHAYFNHGDGLWLALYAWLRLEARLEPHPAYDAATGLARGARGSVDLTPYLGDHTWT